VPDCDLAHSRGPANSALQPLALARTTQLKPGTLADGSASHVEIPGLGAVEPYEDFEWLCSEPLPIGALGGHHCRVFLEGYEEDPNKDDFHAAIANLLSSERDLLGEAAPYVFRYYEDMNSEFDEDDAEYVDADLQDIWKHVQLGREPHVSRRSYGDRGVYVSLECNCDWEPEHGLQLVFKEGRVVVKVGPYDGHLSNADAYDDASLEGVVYKER
jgi:hypothetical protein